MPTITRKEYSMSKMTIGQFKEFIKTLPEEADTKGIAKALGLVLPLNMQLEAVRFDSSSNTISIPALMLDSGETVGRRTVDTRVARNVATKILDICNKNDL